MDVGKKEKIASENNEKKNHKPLADSVKNVDTEGKDRLL